MNIKIEIPGRQPFHIVPGDVVRVGDDTLVYLTENQSAAYRLLQEEHQKHIRKTIEYVEKRCKGE